MNGGRRKRGPYCSVNRHRTPIGVGTSFSASAIDRLLPDGDKRNGPGAINVDRAVGTVFMASGDSSQCVPTSPGCKGVELVPRR